MVCARASFEANQAWCQRLKKPHHLAATKLTSDNNLLGRIDAVNLEYILGDIQTDRGNLHVDGSPHVIRLTTITLWHFDAGSGRRPPHQTRTFSPVAAMSALPSIATKKPTSQQVRDVHANRRHQYLTT
jgi:hypothetical protein